MWNKRLSDYWHFPIIIIIFLVLVNFRLTFYGDPTLSIGTNDTSSYINQIDVPTFSWKALIVRRLPSYVLFFKTFEPENGYELKAVSYPAAPELGTKTKVHQAGFAHIAINQMRLSIFAWIFFAYIFIRHLRKKILKVLAAFLIPFFGFLPQVAEWDSIMMTESVSFSLFLIILGISLELIQRIKREGKKITWFTWGLMIAWFGFFVFWAFMRDSNANTMILMVFLFVILLVIPNIRKRIPVVPFIGVSVLLLGLFVVYALAANQSGRWMGSWISVYNDFIEPYPTHLQYFYERGMPADSDKTDWVMQYGARTYLGMMISNPEFMVKTFIFWMEDVFSENIQPFFYTPPTDAYQWMVSFGNMLHPISSVPFPLTLLTGIFVIIKAFSGENHNDQTFGWMTILLLLNVYGLYGFSFFGDSGGLVRHLLGAVMPMRLMMWLFPIVLADYSLRRSK